MPAFCSASACLCTASELNKDLSFIRSIVPAVVVNASPKFLRLETAVDIAVTAAVAARPPANPACPPKKP